jgi:Domain of unknown function (DUF932)
VEALHSLMSGTSTHYASAFNQAWKRRLRTATARRISQLRLTKAPAPHTSSINERGLGAVAQAGFLPVAPRQTISRIRSPVHARHVIRPRRRYETVSVHDCVPEIVLLNTHDGTSAYQLRVRLFRAVCANGFLVAMAGLLVWRVPHRGDHVNGVVRVALEISERFSELGQLVENMRLTAMRLDEQLQFADAVMRMRFLWHPICGLDAPQPWCPLDLKTSAMTFGER